MLPSMGSGTAIDPPFSIIHMEQGVNPCAVSVEARVYCDVVLEVKLMNLAIYPVYFFFLIGILEGLRSVITKPTKFWGIVQGGNSKNNV